MSQDNPTTPGIDDLHFADALWNRLVSCSRDELRVIDRVLQGLERGRAVYGPLNVNTDPRDFEREAAEEFRDALVYLSAAAVALDDRRHAAGINLLCRQCGALKSGLDELAANGGDS